MNPYECPVCGTGNRANHAPYCIMADIEVALNDTETGMLRAVRFLSKIDPIGDREPLIYSNGQAIPWLVALNLDPARY